MPLTHEEVLAIKKEVIAECKNIFVQIEDCNDKQEKVNEKFANDDKRIDLILQGQEQLRRETRIANEEQKKGLKFNNWLTTTILGVLITGIITLLFF